MKKMDEMDRNIQLRSEEWGYKTVLSALCAWTLYNLFQAFVDEEYQEPNKVVRSAVLAIIIVTVIMSIGAFIYLRG